MHRLLLLLIIMGLSCTPLFITGKSYHAYLIRIIPYSNYKILVYQDQDEGLEFHEMVKLEDTTHLGTRKDFISNIHRQ